MYLLRHSQDVHWEEDGAVHFRRMEEILQNHFSHTKWKVCLAGGGGNKRRFQYCTDSSGTIVYFRALQGTFRTQSYWSFVINFFQYIYHVGSAFNLHSIISSGLILGCLKVRAKDRQYSFCLLILWTEVTRILMWSTWVYHVMHNACIKHGRNIMTRYIRLILILQFGKD